MWLTIAIIAVVVALILGYVLWQSLPRWRG